jgi:hypothetical protein
LRGRNRFEKATSPIATKFLESVVKSALIFSADFLSWKLLRGAKATQVAFTIFLVQKTKYYHYMIGGILKQQLVFLLLPLA